MKIFYCLNLNETSIIKSFPPFVIASHTLKILYTFNACVAYHKGDQPMIRPVDTRRLVFAALLHNKTLPNIPDFGGEFVIRDAPTSN